VKEGQVTLTRFDITRRGVSPYVFFSWNEDLHSF